METIIPSQNNSNNNNNSVQNTIVTRTISRFISLPPSFVCSLSTRKREADLKRDYYLTLTVDYDPKVSKTDAIYAIRGDVWVLKSIKADVISMGFKVKLTDDEEMKKIKGLTQILEFQTKVPEDSTIDSLAWGTLSYVWDPLVDTIQKLIVSHIKTTRAAAAAEAEKRKKTEDVIVIDFEDGYEEMISQIRNEFEVSKLPSLPAPVVLPEKKTKPKRSPPLLADIFGLSESEEEEEEEKVESKNKKEEEKKEEKKSDSTVDNSITERMDVFMELSDEEKKKKREFLTRMAEAKKRKAEERALKGEVHPLTAKAEERKKEKEKEKKKQEEKKERRRAQRKAKSKKTIVLTPAPSSNSNNNNNTNTNTNNNTNNTNNNSQSATPSIFSSIRSLVTDPEEFPDNIDHEDFNIYGNIYASNNESTPSPPPLFSISATRVLSSYVPSVMLNSNPLDSHLVIPQASGMLPKREEEELAEVMRLSLREYELAVERKNKLEEEERAVFFLSKEIHEAKEKAKSDVEEKKRKLPSEQTIESISKRLKAFTGSNTTTTPPPPPPPPPKKECKICFEECTELLAFNGCGHRSVCAKCKKEAIVKCKAICILCRKPFTDIIKIYD